MPLNDEQKAKLAIQLCRWAYGQENCDCHNRKRKFVCSSVLEHAALVAENIIRMVTSQPEQVSHGFPTPVEAAE